MAILNIREAKRGNTKALIAICGQSGSGKTLTALYMARGMVNKASEIGFLDTENGRGAFYADVLDEPFLIADLYPPFTPARYSEAIKEFQAAGIKVLIIDSSSHEWEGEGGCEDIANAALEAGKKMPDWKRAKKEHKGFMNTLLHCNMHIIACVRAREKTSFEDPNKPVSLGIQPICEKNFMFEMTVSIMMENEGRVQKFLKLPEFLKPAFANNDSPYLGAKNGKELARILELGESEDPKIKAAKSEMLLASEKGMDELVKVWDALDSKLKKKLYGHKEICKASALEYERIKKEAEMTPQDTLRNDKHQKIELP
jgi:hypothetical protein